MSVSGAFPSGDPMALKGMAAAIMRLHTAMSKLVSREGELPWIALTEALFWCAALDDSFRSPEYFDARNQEEAGRTVGGLVYARNLHTHALISTGQVTGQGHAGEVRVYPAGEAPPPGRGTLASFSFTWTPLADLPAPGTPERHGRDAMYDERVAGRPLTQPLDEALTWLQSYIEALPA